MEEDLLIEEIENIISCYDGEVQEDLKMLELDNEDIRNICFYVLNNHTIQYEIRQEIEDYCYLKKQEGSGKNEK